MSSNQNLWETLDSEICRNHQRAYELLGTDLLTIFSYVEPNISNAHCYSHQIYQLFLRVCTEFEAVCKLACNRLLIEPQKSNNYNFTTYQRLQNCSGNWKRDGFLVPSGSLSDYQFHIHYWNQLIQPLHSFGNVLGKRKPDWYDDYNSVKHNRLKHFDKANLQNLVLAFFGLCALLDWQGIRANTWVTEVVDNYILIGEKFGYFTVGSDEGPTSRVHF